MVKPFPVVFARATLLFLCAVVFGIATDSACGQVGDVQNVHDPVIIKAGDSFYVFCTGPGIPVRQSSDLYTWHNIGPAFKAPPKWAADEFRGARAPGRRIFRFSTAPITCITLCRGSVKTARPLAWPRAKALIQTVPITVGTTKGW